MLPVGATLQDGKYRIERYLSSGGFGNTYVGVNVKLGSKQIAIKEFFMKNITVRDATTHEVSVSIDANKPTFVEHREKFNKEARRMFELDSAHVARVLDLFEENNTAYYVMELIDGESLSDTVKREGPLDEARVVAYLRQIVAALDDIHRKRIWHLDLKPANAMVDKRDNVKLIDFGASKQGTIDGKMTSSTGGIAYTPGYAPSELMEQSIKYFGPWTDIYSLGATAYALLTAQHPPMPSEVLNEGAAAFDFGPNISRGMRAFILWTMNYRRKHRPQRIEEVQQALDHLEHLDVRVDEDMVATVSDDSQPAPEKKTEQKPEKKTEETPKVATERQTAEDLGRTQYGGAPQEQPVSKPALDIAVAGDEATVVVGREEVATEIAEKPNRRRWIIAAAVAGVLALGGGTWGVINMNRQAPEVAASDTVPADSSGVVTAGQSAPTKQSSAQAAAPASSSASASASASSRTAAENKKTTGNRQVDTNTRDRAASQAVNATKNESSSSSNATEHKVEQRAETKVEPEKKKEPVTPVQSPRINTNRID